MLPQVSSVLKGTKPRRHSAESPPPPSGLSLPGSCERSRSRGRVSAPSVVLTFTAESCVPKHCRVLCVLEIHISRTIYAFRTRGFLPPTHLRLMCAVVRARFFPLLHGVSSYETRRNLYKCFLRVTQLFQKPPREAFLTQFPPTCSKSRPPNSV